MGGPEDKPPPVLQHEPPNGRGSRIIQSQSRFFRETVQQGTNMEAKEPLDYRRTGDKFI